MQTFWRRSQIPSQQKLQNPGDMAQAARLSLRMQKELKLLLSDPPPGASLPLLSADSDLSSIDAGEQFIRPPLSHSVLFPFNRESLIQK